MEDQILFAKALAFAGEKHKLQTRNNGTPYIYHPINVAEIVKDAGYNIRFQIVALLHDVLEDTDASEDDILIFGNDILDAVRLLSRPQGIDENEYVDKILGNRMAAAVKNADKLHNIWECVHSDIPGSIRQEKDIEFAKKYIQKAKKYYYGKFSNALDLAITNADSEINEATVCEIKNWYKISDLKLFILFTC